MSPGLAFGRAQLLVFHEVAAGRAGAAAGAACRTSSTWRSRRSPATTRRSAGPPGRRPGPRRARAEPVSEGSDDLRQWRLPRGRHGLPRETGHTLPARAAARRGRPRDRGEGLRARPPSPTSSTRPGSAARPSTNSSRTGAPASLEATTLLIDELVGARPRPPTCGRESGSNAAGRRPRRDARMVRRRPGGGPLPAGRGGRDRDRSSAPASRPASTASSLDRRGHRRGPPDPTSPAPPASRSAPAMARVYGRGRRRPRRRAARAASRPHLRAPGPVPRRRGGLGRAGTGGGYRS